MLKNYIKLAWIVLGRKKLFTFISLFGISFTLMILMVLTAYFDSELGSHPPLSKSDRISFLNRVVMEQILPDTTRIIDSTAIDGVMANDTTLNIGERTINYSSSSASYSLLDRYLRNVPYAEITSFFSPSQSFDLFINNKKLVFNTLYTDGYYWDIFDFEFVEGDPYRQPAVDDRSPVIVISDAARDAYFGSGVNALGQEIALNRQLFRVVGVVKEISNSKGFLHAEVYLPLTHIQPGILKEPGLMGGFEAAFLSARPADRLKLEAEVARKAAVIPLPDPENYNTLTLQTHTLLEGFALRVLSENDKTVALRWLYSIVGSLLVLFMLIPTLNLINVNVTRILERSDEIGVRKAFGARTRDLLIQFVFENVLLTLIGGIIGLILAIWLIYTLNTSKVLGGVILSFSPSVFVYGFFITLFFGILSGLLPAWRMSRLHVIEALKQNAA
ncbi:MAG: FtsX-like permease family protein [Bacteroidia bacterium]|nr:FtsX-like permease family protein [Bacteroidia bacterium]